MNSVKDHSERARLFNQDEERVNWHDETLWWVRKKRDKAANTVVEWEALRQQASDIKDNVLSNLHDYLIRFEKNVVANGVQIHWAADANEHNEIALQILKDNDVAQMVKSKSMLTEECHLNEFLEANGVDVIDSDLGERIVQLAKEPPSHIVMPCIHWKKEEIGVLFTKHLNTPEGNCDPLVLTAAARLHLREVFLSRKAALTGVNFAVAETGEIVVCTNEGNADMGVHLADVHIASMGIEKIIATRKDLGVFLRLLARSATGQPITTYSSHFRKPRHGQKMHIILVDNGRTKQLAREKFRNSLKCIRCGACMNTCPVYRRSGGHSYHSTIAGPIGAILTPSLDMKQYADLPFASTLCGSCTHVCPVKIDIHEQLYQWRQEIVRSGHVSSQKATGVKIMSGILSRPSLFNIAGKLMRWLIAQKSSLISGRFNIWARQRELPDVPQKSFDEWYKKNGRK
jgi:L-lactate dehydrogenase complex protein LldF